MTPSSGQRSLRRPKENRMPVLYICPHCKAGFESREHGWADACRHIREKHRVRQSSGRSFHQEKVPGDNLFGSFEPVVSAGPTR